MFSNSSSFCLRILCILVALVILANCFLVPVYASALLYEVFAVTAENLIASLIRALGVYVSDGINNSMAEGLALWEDLCDFIVSKLPDKYLYANAAGELMVKMVFKDGLYYVDRNLISLVLSLLSSPSPVNEDYPEFIQPVGYGFNFNRSAENMVNKLFEEAKAKGLSLDVYTRNLSKCYLISFNKSTELGPYGSPFIVFTNGIVDFDYSDGILNVIVGAGHSIVLYRDPSTGTGDGIYRPASSSALAWSTEASSAQCTVYQGEITVDLDDSIGPAPADSIIADYVATEIPATWDQASTVVDDDRVGGTIEGLPVSVPLTPTGAATAPWEDVVSGTTVESELVAVPDTGVDTGTEVVPDTNTGILTEILTGIKGLAVSITQPIASSISEAVAAITDFFNPRYENLGFYSLPGIKDFFPFCIPFDLYAFMCVLCADPVAPVFTFSCPLPGGGVYDVQIDLSSWDGVAATIRYAVIAIYIVSLANVTRKMIKW